MFVLKRLFNFYINASIHLGLMAYAFVRITEFYFRLPYNKVLDYTIFFGTILAYNFVKYTEVSKLYHRNLTKSLKSIQVFSVISLLFTLYYANQLALKTIFYFVPFGLLTVLYAIPFLSKFQKNLRNISFIKNGVIAIVWAGVTVLIPIVDAQRAIDYIVILQVLQRFIIIMVLMIPFDIRDVNYDHQKLKTIPQIIGVQQAKKVGYVLLLFTLVIEFVIAPSQLFKNVYLGVFFLMIFALMRSTISQQKYFYSFFVDGIAFLWWISLLLILSFLPLY